MSKLLVKGGKKPLQGSVRISGAKNAAVAIIPAAVLTLAPVRLENLPEISDIRILVEILQSIGVRADQPEPGVLILDSSGLDNFKPPFYLVSKLRASYYLLGALAGRCGRAEVPAPGGCDLGPRPIDQHLKGLTALGAQVEVGHGLVKVTANGLYGNTVYLDVVSVGATINLMLTAVRARGKTVIKNAAKEPEIVDVANFLNALGARISGAGTDVIKITGVEELGGGVHSVIPDRIEAGTYMFAAAATAGDVLLLDVIPKHLDPVIAKLREMGIDVEVCGDRVRVSGGRTPRAVDLKTFPYPGFPTDLQSLAMTMLTSAEGNSVITENVFENRFRHVDELVKMGARIKVEGRTALVEGSCRLGGAPVSATDLRAGAAFIVAGLMADGETLISKIDHVHRGYENICGKFRSLGAVITEVE
ncbi:MAG: UDP-N-acetylglucosamine 1-carboxyvinyltransferase 2 [Syntrophomonadaceae bacterium]|nr:UDP-N-acetylglucosamine 1-carboxyvinyltransferase 2 [Bacillota bacterium]